MNPNNIDKFLEAIFRSRGNQDLVRRDPDHSERYGRYSYSRDQYPQDSQEKLKDEIEYLQKINKKLRDENVQLLYIEKKNNELKEENLRLRNERNQTTQDFDNFIYHLKNDPNKAIRIFPNRWERCKFQDGPCKYGNKCKFYHLNDYRFGKGGYPRYVIYNSENINKNNKRARYWEDK
jgi:hypothetical protein